MYDVCMLILKIRKYAQKMYVCRYIGVKVDRY